MTMNTFAQHIWAYSFPDREMRAALNAGWRRRDLVWERLSEEGNLLAEDGRLGAAKIRFWLAWLVARLFFEPGDLRLGASHANCAFAAQSSNSRRAARRHYERALSIWSGAPSAITAMKIIPRARSSLFHLRMEARHWETYCANMRTRTSNFASETGACLRAQAMGQNAPYRLFYRWKGEKPSVFDDTRKILAACLLIAQRDMPAD